MEVTKAINPRFTDFVFDWDYKTYLLCGGYGSSKSYNAGFKLILLLFQECRKALVIREVYDTIRESCFDLLCEILSDMDLLEEGNRRYSNKVIAKTSPHQLIFPNGSRVIFKGMDKPTKLKSINNVSVVWLEEASEIKYAGYKEIRGRLRPPNCKPYIFLTTNPVDKQNWIYTHFFKRTDPSTGKETVILDDKRLYEKGTIVKNGVYYHHSTCDDNYFLQAEYIKELDDLRNYDPDLYRVARLGQFGTNGLRVLPQFEVAPDVDTFAEMMSTAAMRFCGMDFGFETSYNAVIRVAVDDKKKILYIYDEYYKNHMTDDKTAVELKKLGYDKIPIVSDSAEPKTIQFYCQEGFRMRACHKSAGSRLENTRKIKRFKRIICSPECPNTIRELQNLTYKQDNKGLTIYDEFNIDPHTFSAIWYALDTYTVADVKYKANNSWGAETY